ncbi:MAG: glycosyl hydrolase family 18 protein, partial [Bacteroidota bacterium]
VGIPVEAGPRPFLTLHPVDQSISRPLTGDLEEGRQRRQEVTVVFAFFLLNPLGMELYGQEADKNEKAAKGDEMEAKKAEKEAKKGLKKLLSFKNFFHHSDSSRLAKRYIRWHKRLTRGDEDYRFTIHKDSLGELFPFKRENHNPLSGEVFGWYPSWEKDLYKNLDYSLLSTVAYFSYEVNHRTGKADTVHDWMNTKLVDSILKYEDQGKKVLLTVSLFGNHKVKSFLKNTRAGDTLIDNVIKMIAARKAHGVCLDFEGVVHSQRKRYNSFVAQLSQQLKNTDSTYQLYMAIPAVDWGKIIQYDLLVPKVDRFVMMGYNYYGSTSKVAGPVAPLQGDTLWDPFNIKRSVKEYLDNGIPKSKMILALPFYGSIWETKTGEKGSRARRFIGSRTIDYIKHEMENKPSLEMQFDTISKTSWYSYVVRDSVRNKRRFRQLWFDSDSAFADKLRYIKQEELRGLGIWALGYNKRYDNYWRKIEMTYSKMDTTKVQLPDLKNLDSIVVIFKGNGKSDTTVVASKTNKAKTKEGKDEGEEAGGSFVDTLGGLNDKLKEISGMSDLLILALGFVVLFGGIGLVISMFKPNTRMFFFNSRAYTIYFTVILSVFLMVLMRMIDAIRDPSVVLLFGFVIGAIVVYLVSRYVQKVKRNLP